MKNAFLIAALLFLGYSFLQPSGLPKPPDTPVVVEGPVSIALRSASSEDRRAVAAVYSALADVTERDATDRLLGTTQAWRSCHSAALRLAVGGTSLVGRYPGLDSAVEQVLAQFFTLDNQSISPDIRAKIVAGCREVAKQSGG